MATLAFGIIGAGIGGAIGGPAGAKLGFSIGAMIGGVADMPHPVQEVGRLSDLRVSGSSYGAAIARIWGRARVPGNIIWATDLSQYSTSSQQGGKGGGQTTRTYGYQTSCAVAICGAGRNIKLLKVWADDLVIWEDGRLVGDGAGTEPTVYDCDTVGGILAATGYTAEQYADMSGGARAYLKLLCQAKNTGTAATVNLRYYDGAGDQEPDTLIESIEGTAPAYRGTAYVVFENLDLANYGNRIPNFSFLVETDEVTIGDVLEDLAAEVGIPAEDLDIAEATDVVAGCILASRGPVSGILSSLTSAYAYDLVEVDGLLRLVKRGGEPALTLSIDDLGAIAADGDPPAGSRIEEVRRQEVELPSRVDVSFFDLETDLQQNSQGAVRITASELNNSVSVNLPLALTADEGRAIAERLLSEEWIGRTTYASAAGPKYYRLCGGDVVLLPIDGALCRVRIVGADLGLFAEQRLQFVLDDAAVLEQSTPGGAPAPVTSSYLAPVPTVFYPWSGAELRDEDGLAPGFYVAGTGAPGWRGGRIHYSPDAGASWIDSGVNVSVRSVFGMADTALPDAVDSSVWDETGTVDVTVNDGTLASTTQTEVDQGANIAMVGGELIGFATVTLLGDREYRLSTLRRGLRGTPMTGHTSSDTFIRVAPSGVVRVSLPVSLIGEELLVKVVSDYQALADVTAETVTIAAPTAPYATPAEVDVVATDLADHTAAVDPHPQYTDAAELEAAILAHTLMADPHPGYATDADLATHAATAATAAVLGHVMISAVAALALGTAAAGSTGQAADAGHVHPMPTLDQVVASGASCTNPVTINYTTGNAGGLKVIDDGNASWVKAESYGNSNVFGGVFNTLFARGSYASPLYPSSGDILGNFASAAYDESLPGFRTLNQIRSTARGTWSSTAMPTYMAFYTTPDGSKSSTESARLTPVGLYLGANTDPAAKLHFPASTAQAGGMQFGSDFAVFRSGTALLTMQAASTAAGTGRGILSLTDSSTFAAGVGAGIYFGGKYNTAGNVAGFATIHGFKATATDGDFSGGLIFTTRATGAAPATALTLNPDKSAVFAGKVSASVGLGVPHVAADLLLPSNGDVWFRSDTLQLSIYTGGAVKRSAAFT